MVEHLPPRTFKLNWSTEYTQEKWDSPGPLFKWFRKKKKICLLLRSKIVLSPEKKSIWSPCRRNLASNFLIVNFYKRSFFIALLLPRVSNQGSESTGCKQSSQITRRWILQTLVADFGSSELFRCSQDHTQVEFRDGLHGFCTPPISSPSIIPSLPHAHTALPPTVIPMSPYPWGQEHVCAPL